MDLRNCLFKSKYSILHLEFHPTFSSLFFEAAKIILNSSPHPDALQFSQLCVSYRSTRGCLCPPLTLLLKTLSCSRVRAASAVPHSGRPSSLAMSCRWLSHWTVPLKPHLPRWKSTIWGGTRNSVNHRQPWRRIPAVGAGRTLQSTSVGTYWAPFPVLEQPNGVGRGMDGTCTSSSVSTLCWTQLCSLGSTQKTENHSSFHRDRRINSFSKASNQLWLFYLYRRKKAVFCAWAGCVTPGRPRQAAHIVRLPAFLSFQGDRAHRHVGLSPRQPGHGCLQTWEVPAEHAGAGFWFCRRFLWDEEANCSACLHLGSLFVK